jgi:uncharacterized flavoprotein (TIGR03862 family)
MKKSITIIGGGPSALMLAAQLDEQKFDITIYERNAAVGRKFLVAGDGGFNLTHSEKTEQFISRYTPAPFFKNVISAFNSEDLRKWFKSISIETFVGSSKRVFPVKEIKPIDVLNAILNVLKQKNISIKTKHIWQGWNNDQLIFTDASTPENKQIYVKSDIVIFALGGASWKVTGSDGTWSNFFTDKKIKTIPFQSSNCAFEIKWNKTFINVAEGQSLKNISLTCDSIEKKGELVITKFGLEGGAIYALSPAIRKQLNDKKSAQLFLDLKPSIALDEIKNKLIHKGNKSLSKQLTSVLNINDVQLALLKTILTKEEFTRPELLAKKIKQLPIIVTDLAHIDDAISTVGGIALTEIDENFQLKIMPNHYVIGEMLDWDAPTGGYLLQGCFSMGYGLANNLNAVIKV